MTVSSSTRSPGSKRKYSQEQKDEFFLVFDRLKSTRKAARELGLNPDTCAGWVRKAGLKSYGPEDLEHVAQELNGRPRKTLGWDTPAERLRDLLLTT